MLTAQSDLQPQEKQIIVIPANPLVAPNRTFPRQLRAAAYCRVSTDQEEQLTSYEAQVAYYTDKIISNPEWTLAGIFADEGITGTSVKKRTNYQPVCEKHGRLPELHPGTQGTGDSGHF